MTEKPALRVAPPDFLDWPDLRELLRVLPEARIVGGAVRDALLGAAVSDVDLATPRSPEDVRTALEAANVRAIPTGLAHGTVTAVPGARTFEITTLRRDVETDGRHARVAFTGDWRDDAARRDFTINALSMTAAGEVFDYFGGVDDLRAGRVRFVGEAARRIAEDFLRILRFFRFHARFGRLPPEEREAAAIREAAPELRRLSAERVWSELRQILAGPNADVAMRLMQELGVLPVLLPEGADLGRFEGLIARGAPADPVLRLAGLLSDAANPVAFADRLKLSTAERDRLVAIRSGPVPGPALDDADLRRLLAEEEPDILITRSWVFGGGSPDWAALRGRLGSMPRPRFPLAGRDVLAAGIEPGPRVGRLLRDVRRWWMERGCSPDEAECRERLRKVIADVGCISEAQCTNEGRSP